MNEGEPMQKIGKIENPDQVREILRNDPRKVPDRRVKNWRPDPKIDPSKVRHEKPQGGIQQ